jgi:hypothetical protein
LEERMMKWECRPLWALAVSVMAGVGCGSDSGDGTLPPSADASEDADGATDDADAALGSDSGEDSGLDASDDPSDPDTTPDVAPDVPPDTTPPPICGDETFCIDPRTGNRNVAICREAGYPAGTRCVAVDAVTACCEGPFRCTSDLSCEERRESEGFCADPRYPCVCDVDAGTCSLAVCSEDAECGAGSVCVDGLCAEPGLAGDYRGRALTPTAWMRVGDTLALRGVAVRTSDPNRTDRTLPLEWTVETGGGAVSLAGSMLTATAPGEATVLVRVAGNAGDPGDAVRVVVVEGATDGFIVVHAVDEATRLRIESDVHVLFVPQADPAAAEQETTDVGVVSWDAPGGLVDVHVFADGYSYMSFIGVTDGTLVVPLPPIERADFREERDGFVCDTSVPGTYRDESGCGEPSQAPCMCYTVQNIDVVRGSPDFGLVQGDGELSVSLGGFSLGNSLLDLNFDRIVGPQIRRIIPPNPVINVDDPVDIPSGVTLFLNNQPFVDSFIGAAPAGRRTVWSVGGTVPLGETLRILLPSLSGNLEFGPIIAAILPLFSDFYSGVTDPIELVSEGTFPVRDPGLRLNVPTQRRVSILSPELPRIADGWSDTAIFLGGAIVPGDGFVPLGVSGGTDVLGRGEADGRIDGNHDTPEVDPVSLSMAPMHGSIATPHTRYAFASVALLLGDDLPGAPREATAALFTVLDAGAPLPTVLPYGDATYPPFAFGSEWQNDEGQRTMALDDVDASSYDFYRFVFQGRDNRNWIVLAPETTTRFSLPEVPESLASDPIASARVQVVAIRLRASEGATYEGLVEARTGSLLDLFEFVEGFSLLGL